MISMLGTIWNTLFKQPIAQLLLWLTALTGNMGVAIILLTIIVQLVLTPLRIPSLKSAQKMKDLKPKLDGLKEKHEGDQMALAQAQMELYKQHGVSPLGGILPMLLSIPIIIALYRVLLTTLQNGAGVSTSFLWLDLTQSDPYFVLPVVVGLSQWLMTRLMRGNQPTPQEGPASAKASAGKPEGKEGQGDSMQEMMQSMQSQMGFIFPIMSAFIVATLPSGVGIYWLTSTAFTTLQQRIVR